MHEQVTTAEASPETQRRTADQAGPAAAEAEELSERRSHVDYRLDISMRYHHKRESFFSTLGSACHFVTLLASTGVVAQAVAGNPAGLWLGLAVAMAQTVVIVFRPGDQAKFHAVMRQRYGEVALAWHDAHKADVGGAERRCMQIEQDEQPTHNHVLALAHNEYASSIGSDELQPVTWWQRLLAHVVLGDVVKVGAGKG